MELPELVTCETGNGTGTVGNGRKRSISGVWKAPLQFYSTRCSVIQHHAVNRQKVTYYTVEHILLKNYFGDLPHGAVQCDRFSTVMRGTEINLYQQELLGE
jgi:hypothetical protein